MKQSSGHRYNARSPLPFGTKWNHLQLQFAAHKLLGEWEYAVTARIIHLGVQAVAVSLRNRTAGRQTGEKRTESRKTLVCDKRERAINYLRVLSWPSLNITVFWFLQKYLFKGKWSLAKSYFKQNYCHACHTRLAVFFTLPSCCLSSLVMTGRRYIKAASSSQSLTKLSTQTIPESFRDRQNPLAYISLVRPGSQCVLDFLLPPSPSPLPHKKA